MTVASLGRLSVSALSSWNWTLDQDLAFWSQAGIEHVGIWTEKLDGPGWDDAVARVAAAGLRISNLISAGPFTLDQPARWPEQRERLIAMLDAAEIIEAPLLVLTTGPANGLDWEEAAAALESAIGPVLDLGHEIPIAFEHTNSLRPDIGFLHTLADAIDFARHLGVGVCMECNACWAERGLYQTITDGVEFLSIVQVDDFVVGTRDTPNRVVPGDGDIPLERIIGHLLAAGYKGDFDLEIVGPRIEDEGYGPAIIRSVDAMTTMLDKLNA
jgi:sugar phosphate isomerase/epimerase